MSLARGSRSVGFHVFHDLVRRDGLTRAWKDALAFERLPRPQQEEDQLRRLRWLVSHAARHVPYWRELLASIDARTVGYDDLRRLPLLTKDVIRRAPERMIVDDPRLVAMAPNATSGSTGESLRFFVDQDRAHHRAAATFRFHGWTGVSPFDREARLWGARFDEPHGSLRERLRGWMHPIIFLSSYRLSPADMERYAKTIADFKPALLVSYPSPLERFAAYCEQTSTRFPSLRAIVTSAEQLLEHQRRSVEAALGVPIFDRYGSREFANVAMECERHDGLHVATDRVWLEVLDDAGQPVAPGEVGQVVITDLDNWAMPFLRYRTGDLAVWSEDPCACGRTLPKLARLEGRVFEVIRTPSGHGISGTFWPQVLKQASRRLRNFQVVQEDPARIRIRVQTDDGLPFDESERSHVLEKVREHAPDLAVTFELVEEILPTAAGKRIQVVGLGRDRQENPS